VALFAPVGRAGLALRGFFVLFAAVTANATGRPFQDVLWRSLPFGLLTILGPLAAGYAVAASYRKSQRSNPEPTVEQLAKSRTQPPPLRRDL
jgi:hypothetical protein